MLLRSSLFFFFFFNDTATTEIYTLSLHDALPISASAIGFARPVASPTVQRSSVPSGTWAVGQRGQPESVAVLAETIICPAAPTGEKRSTRTALARRSSNATPSSETLSVYSGKTTSATCDALSLTTRRS